MEWAKDCVSGVGPCDILPGICIGSASSEEGGHDSGPDEGGVGDCNSICDRSLGVWSD